MLAPNKTLAAQLYGEFKRVLSAQRGRVLRQLLRLLPARGLRPVAATRISRRTPRSTSTSSRCACRRRRRCCRARDAIIVATVSAIYGLGDPNEYLKMRMHLMRGEHIDQRELIRHLTELQYTRGDYELRRGTYRVRGEVIDVFPAESESEALRIELFDGEIENLAIFDPLTGEVMRKVPRYTVYPKTHYVTTRDSVLRRDRHDQGRAQGAPRLSLQGEQARRGAAPAAAHAVRHRDDGRDRLLPGHRELFAPSDRTPARRAAADVVRLPAARRAARRRRIARDDSAARRDVQGRSLAQGDAGRVRFPPAVGAGQSAAQVRGVGEPRAAHDLRVGDAGSVRDRQIDRQHHRARRASDRACRSRGRSAPGAHAGRRSSFARSTSASRSAIACW